MYAFRRFFIVFNCDLSFSVGTEIRQKSRFSCVRKTLCKLVRKRDGQRHKLFGFPASIAEHHSLIACTEQIFGVAAFFVFKRAVNAHSNIRALAVDSNGYFNLVVCKRAESIARFLYNIPRNFFIVDDGKSCNFAHNNKSVVCGAAFHGAPCHIVDF